MIKLFKELKEGLEEALAYSKREVSLKSEFIETNEPKKNINPAWAEN